MTNKLHLDLEIALPPPYSIKKAKSAHSQVSLNFPFGLFIVEGYM